MRYSTYAEKEEDDDNEFLRDEDLLDHLSQHHFSNSDDDEFEDRLM